MTFQEYLNQEDPVRMPEVIVTPEDVYHITKALEFEKNVQGISHRITLDIQGELIGYAVKDNILWTLDGDGNPKSRSCFKLKL